MKGHASCSDVWQGLVEGFDKFGNDQADMLAVAGAARKVSPDAMKQHERIVLTVSLQRMFLEIAFARATTAAHETQSSSSCSPDNASDSDSRSSSSSTTTSSSQCSRSTTSTSS